MTEVIYPGPSRESADNAPGRLTAEELEEARALLRASPLFAGVPEEELEATCRQLTPARFSPGEDIIRARELGDCCYFIRSGQPEVVGDDLIGEEAPVRFVARGEIIGEVALLKDVLRIATVRAVTETSAFVLDRESFLRLVEAVPVLVQRLRQRVELAERVMFLRLASPFARLPEDAVVRLAHGLRQVRVLAGELAVREGDRGDCFFLVRSGRFEVLRGGRRVQELASGDYFGEMALLLDQPRNATVRAREDSELLALRRPAFVELVRDHPQLRAHFNEMMRARGAIVTPDGDVQLTTPPEIVLPTERRPFWIALALGLGLFFALSDATRVSSAPALAFLTLIVGALVGPVSYVVYLASTNVLTWQPRRIAITFAIAALAVPLTARIEFAIGTLGTGLPGALTAAAVEEPAKVLIIVWLLRRPEMRFQMDGVIFGAAAGMGFSAFESLNYGFLNMSSMSLMLGILWFRAMLSPFTHGTWTAIICAVIWRVKGTGLPRWDWRVLAAFAVSIGLHVAWDWAPVRFPLQYYYMGVGVVGLAILGLLVRGARRQQGSAVVALNPELLSRARTSQHAPVACLRCGQMAPSGAHFCPRCGVALRL